MTTRTAPTGEHLWMLNTLMEIKAAADDTGGAFSLVEQLVTPDGDPPVHVHHHEDESFYVLVGEVEVTIGGERRVARPGDFVFGPRGVPHTYAVRSEQARLLVLSSPGGVERFFRAVGEPAGAVALPQPQAPDPAHVVRVAAAHGIEILPPPA